MTVTKSLLSVVTVITVLPFAEDFKFFKKQHYYLVPHVDSSPFKKRGHDTSV